MVRDAEAAPKGGAAFKGEGLLRVAVLMTVIALLASSAASASHTPRHTVNVLERGLRGTPMAGTERILEAQGRRHGVSPFFMAAVAATESSLGRAPCSNNRRNVWGLASCVNSWPVPYFETWREAISFYARFLASRWPGHSTPYSFRGYAACSDCWARKVSYWMGALFGVPAETRYP